MPSVDSLVTVDRATAARHAHTLNGVAGNIGAVSVQAAASAVEDLIKEGADCQLALAELANTLDGLVDAVPLPRQPDPRAQVDASRMSTDELPPLLNRLKSLLEDDDAEALDLVDEIASRAENETERERVRAESV